MNDTKSRPDQPGQSVVVASFEYNAWANLRLLDFCSGLSEEQLDSTTAGGYGTIRKTLMHIVYSEVSYVSRVNGKLPPDPLPREVFPGFDPLCAAVKWANEELLDLALSARGDTVVVDTWPEGTEKYKLADLMVQATSHAVEHRTQVASIITTLGLEPPEMSTWGWMEDSGALEVTRFGQS